MNLIGYVREAKSRETLDYQIHSLMDHGLSIENIFKERRSSLDSERPALSECLNSLDKDDILIVTKLNQIASSVIHLSQIKNTLEEKEAHFRVLNQGIDTYNQITLDAFSMITLFSEFEMDLRVERQLEGIQKARKNGVKFGRKPINLEIKEKIQQLYNEGQSVGQISIKLAIGRSTIYRLLK